MKKLFVLAALLMATPSAHAGNSISFQIEGHKIRVTAPRNCSSLSCIQISAPSLSDSSISGSSLGNFKGFKSKGSSDDTEVAEPAPTTAPVTAPAPAVQATAPQPAAAVTSPAPAASPPPAAPTTVATISPAPSVAVEASPAPTTAPHAAPVAAALGAASTGVAAAEVAPIDATLADTAAFCAAYDVAPQASANCVIVAGKRAGETTYAAVMVLATDRADVNKAVRHQLGVRKISFAPMAEATERSQMAYGGITPVGLPSEWPVLVDDAVATAPWVVVGSGTRGSKLLLPGARVAELRSAHVMLLRQVA